MTTPHPRSDLLKAIADGKKIEYRDKNSSFDGRWFTATLKTVATDIGVHEFRIAPETILVNGVEVPKPSEKSTAYQVVMQFCNYNSSPTSKCISTWFDTEADARTVFDALCKPFKEGV